MKETIAIIGAGVAGLAAAKLLARPDRRVLLIDRSFEPVAQSHQLHVLLSRGQQLLEQQFPLPYRQICEDCPEINWGSDIYWRSPVGPFPKRHLAVSTRLLSRAYLDRLLIEDLRKTPGCELIEDSVKALTLTADRGRVGSIALADGRQIECDVCIDSLGRGSRTRQFLESEFSTPVASEELRTALRYYSFSARRRSPGEFKQVYFQIDPQKELYGGVISPVEGQRLIATFITTDREFELDGNPFHLIKDRVFEEFVGQVEFEPDHHAFGQLHNQRHHYESYRHLPSNLFLIGDSVCQFNPVFGQGMTVALQSAAMLDDYLNRSGDRDQRSTAFQKTLARSIRFPWMISTMDPYNPAAAPGWTQRITRALMHQVMRRSQSDPRSHQTLVSALHMLDSPLRLGRSLSPF